MLGYAFFAVCGACAAVSIWHMVRTLSKLDRAIEQNAASPTWSELTDGGLTLEHRGPLLTFWAGGRTRSREGSSMALDIFVAVDESALVVVAGQPWPRRPQIAWLERSEDGPLLRVRSGYWGTIISDDESGILLQRPNHTPEKVTLDLRRRGWIVDGVPPLDDLPPAPAER